MSRDSKVAIDAIRLARIVQLFYIRLQLPSHNDLTALKEPWKSRPGHICYLVQVGSVGNIEIRQGWVWDFTVEICKLKRSIGSFRATAPFCRASLRRKGNSTSLPKPRQKMGTWTAWFAVLVNDRTWSTSVSLSVDWPAVRNMMIGSVLFFCYWDTTEAVRFRSEAQVSTP